MTTPKPGIYYDIDPIVYRAWRGISPSSAKAALRTAQAYRCQAVVEITDEIILGSAIHTCVLEPDLFPLRVVIWQGGRRAGKEWDAFEAANANKIILPAPFYQRALKVRDALNSCAEMRELWNRQRQVEPSLVWQYPATSSPITLDCKGRPDCISDRIYDLKTVYEIPLPSTNEDRVFWWADGRGHFHQQGGYQDGYERITGETILSCMIYAETRPPYHVVFKPVDEIVSEFARGRWRKSLETIAKAMHTNNYPGLTPTPFTLPESAMSAEDLDLDFTGTE